MTLPSRAINRRSFLQSAAAAVVAGTFSGPTRAQEDRPNIVFILADDLGYADVSCYGQQDYSTPNVDRLAKEGMRFTQGYANSAVCTPTRVALMTGRYQMRLPVGLEEPLGSPNSAPGIGLPAEHPTLPSLLRGAGYATALIGKWHLGYLPTFGPLKSGYEQFFGIFSGGADYFVHGSRSRSPLYEQDTPVDRIGYMTNLLAERAVLAIDGYAKMKRPFLLSLHFTAPHFPFQGPEDGSGSTRAAASTDSGDTRRTYASMVRNLDENIGRVLSALQARAFADNTIVVFTSDNGGERTVSTGPFSGGKGQLLEGGLRVPAIVRWPRQVRAGTVSDQVMITMDWVPTLLAAANVPAKSAYSSDGENLLPLFTAGVASHPRKLYWRFKAREQRAMRDGDWKYLRVGANESLFDLSNDPREQANLRTRHPEVFERLKREWEGWNQTMLPERPGPALRQKPPLLTPKK